MKIFIINPNSDPKMTEAIQKSADQFSGGDFEVVCQPTPGAPEFIETYEDQIKAASGMIQLIRENEDETNDNNDIEKFLDAAKLAVEEDMAEVIVLGCAGMTGLDKTLEENLGLLF